MPIDIVKQYRTIYQDCYVQQTLNVLVPGFELKTDAHVTVSGQDIGFHSSRIAVSFAGLPHREILASNNVKKNDDGSMVGGILVNPILIEMASALRKMVLAEEWIEVMLGFRDGKRTSKSTINRIDMIIMFYRLGHRAPWQDTDEETSELTEALRHLLVPTDLLEGMAKDLGFSLRQVPEMIASDLTNAETALQELATSFAERWSVYRELVTDRIREILFGDAFDE